MDITRREACRGKQKSSGKDTDSPGPSDEEHTDSEGSELALSIDDVALLENGMARLSLESCEKTPANTGNVSMENDPIVQAAVDIDVDTELLVENDATDAVS